MRRLLSGLVALEVVAACALVGLRLRATEPIPPAVEQYNDRLTGQELLALPEQFLFDSAVKWRTLAETYAALGYFSKADACFRRAVAADPRSAEITLHHGYCLVRLGRLTEARDAFSRVLAEGDGRLSSRACYHLGETHLRLEQPEEAARSFLRAGDGDFPSVYQRAKLLVRSGRAAEARPLLAALAEAFPRDVRVCLLRARAAAELGDDEALSRARDSAEAADVDLVLDDLEAFFKPIRARYGMAREITRAVELEQAGNAAAGAERLTRLVGGDTRWENAYLFLVQDAAAMHWRAGNAKAARELAGRQIDQEGFPTPTAWQLRGEIEFGEQNWTQAFAAWTRAERMQPNAVDHVKLATVVEHLGDVPAARRNLALAGQFSGIDFFREGKIDEARTMLRQAAKIDGEVSEIWFYLGECERLSGDHRQAAAAYRRCAELNPAHGRAAARLRQFRESP
jgi:tetratricopeptide (TPR) repeat protein